MVHKKKSGIIGIILAGGTGSRLYPVTNSINKHLLPVHDKPMIFYSLSVLMLAGIRDIILITNKNDIKHFKNLLGNGKNYGINIIYKIQKKPEGLGQAFLITKKIIKNKKVCMVLGDNIFFGQSFSVMLKKAIEDLDGCSLFTYPVKNPSEFGIIHLDKNNKPTSITEKPTKYKSNLSVTGLYFYDESVYNFAKKNKKSNRGEYEITSINQMYLTENKLFINKLGRGFFWIDAGTHENLNLASNFVQTVENRLGMKVACLEEISLKNKWISLDMLRKNIKKLPKNSYTDYLKSIAY